MRFLGADNFFFISQDFILYFIPFVLDGLEKLKFKGEGGDNRFTIIAIFSSLLCRPAAANRNGVRFRTKYTADVVTRLSSQCKRGPHFRFAPWLKERRNQICPPPPCKQHARNSTSGKIPCIRERFYIRQSGCCATQPILPRQQDPCLSLSSSPIAFYSVVRSPKLNKISDGITTGL